VGEAGGAPRLERWVEGRVNRGQCDSRGELNTIEVVLMDSV
jgi:hypothetical protein